MTTKKCFCSGNNNAEKCNCDNKPNGAAGQGLGLGEGGDEQFGGPAGAGGPGQGCQGGRGIQRFDGTEASRGGEGNQGFGGPDGRGGRSGGLKKCHCKGKKTGEKCSICGHDPGGAVGLLACSSSLIPLMVFTTGSFLTMRFALLAAELD